MATVTKPIALDESFNTTEVTPRNIADVLAEGLSHITGRTASEVEYDNTESELTADNVQDAIDELKSDIPTVNDGTLTIQQNGETKGTFTANQSGNSTVNIETPTTDIQTAVDEFETYNGGLLSECKVTLVPVQSGSGDPSPDNVRPISGHTQVEVDVSDGQTTQEQVTVNLGGTYYGGSVDLVSGVMKATHKGVDMGNLTWIYSSSVNSMVTTISDAKQPSADDVELDALLPICKVIKASRRMQETGIRAYMFADNTYDFYIRDSGYVDATAFTTFVTGMAMTYELATPQTIQLTPQQIEALVGENHLSAPLEGQEITESKYKQMFTFDDVIAYIQSLS